MMIFGKKKEKAKSAIAIHSGEEISAMRRSGYIANQILHAVASLVEPGVTTSELNDIANKRLVGEGVEPAFLGYDSFPAVLCASVDDVAVHGVPNDTPLKEGGLLKLDFGVIFEGWYSDTAITVPIGNVSVDALRLITVTEDALKHGITAAQPGGHVGDISAAIQSHVEEAGYEVIRELTGHGIGRTLHEAPQVPNFGNAGTGEELLPGMVIAIEPITSFSTKHVELGKDGFGYVTDNGSLSAHFEHTVAITDSGPMILSTYET